MGNGNPAKPNILVLCTDQQRHDALGVTGDGTVLTPNIDGIAARGVIFEACYAQSTVCAPARATLATGKYPHSHGLWANGVELPVNEPLLTSEMARAGYRCGWIGKQHFGPAFGGRDEIPRDDGISLRAWSHDPRHPSRSNAYHRWLEAKFPDLFRLATEGRLCDDSDDPELSGFDCLPLEASYNRWIGSEAIDMIGRLEHGSDEPWCLWVNFFDPHHPFISPENYLSLYPEDEVEYVPCPPEELAEQPEPLQRMRARANAGAARSYEDYSIEGLKKVIRAYRAMVSHVDEEVGRILDAVDACRRTTATLFLSDHGEMLGDHGLLLKGPAMYEEAVRTPLILSWPDVVPAGVRRASPVEHVDVPATLLDLAGLGEVAFGQGTSLLGYAMGQSEAPREWALCEYRDSGAPMNPPAVCTMFRSGEMKMVIYHRTAGNGQEREMQIFDLRADPHEHKNLAGGESGPALASALVEELLDRLVESERKPSDRVAAW